jgi:Tfp pilus assembly protein PilV
MPSILYPPKANGFILLEVLLAMSLIAGAWVGLCNQYQVMALRFVQSQEKRLQIREQINQFEISQAKSK